jgi:hypothetical protein
VKALLERLMPGGGRAFLAHIEPDGHPYDPEWQQAVGRFPDLSTVVVRSAAQAAAQLPAEFTDRVYALGRDQAFQGFWPLMPG